MQRPTIRTLPLIALALLLLGLVGCASGRTPGEQISDATITGKVEAKLAADPEVNNFEIDVDTIDGVVTLRGQVEEPGDREEAEKLARATKGVTDVRNEIRIGDKKLAAHVDDAWIQSKIAAKLTADTQTNPLKIDIDVSEGVVTLSGQVRSAASREEAAKLAMATRGVKEVKNEIEVVAERADS